jgi:hypothetical protein
MVRAAVGVFYWVVVALLSLFGVYVSVAEGRLWPGLLVPAALALFGLWWPGLGYSGAGLIVFGAYPALLVTRSVADQIAGMNWSCSDVAFDGISNPGGGKFGCTVVSVDLVLFGVCMWAVAFLGTLLPWDRPRPAGT